MIPDDSHDLSTFAFVHEQFDCSTQQIDDGIEMKKIESFD